MTKTPIDSIVIPTRFVQACVGWTGGVDCMLYAITSTGNLTTGTRRPCGCDSDEKWYLHIWRRLSIDLSVVVGVAREQDTGTGYDGDDAEALAEFEEWVDEVIARLEDEYGLADWDG